MDNIIPMTETFILSELESSMKTTLIGIGILSIILIILGIWLFKMYESRKKEISDTGKWSKKKNVLYLLACLFLVFIFMTFLHIFVRHVESVVTIQYAIKNHTYEIEEYKVLEKYFEIETDADMDSHYRFYLELENYGEEVVSEKEFEKVTIGDFVYLIFAVKGEKRCNTGNIYLVGEYFYPN